MADKMAAAYQFALVVTITQLFLIGFLPYFIYGLLLINSPSSLNTGFV